MKKFLALLLTVCLLTSMLTFVGSADDTSLNVTGATIISDSYAALHFSEAVSCENFAGPYFIAAFKQTDALTTAMKGNESTYARVGLKYAAISSDKKTVYLSGSGLLDMYNRTGAWANYANDTAYELIIGVDGWGLAGQQYTIKSFDGSKSLASLGNIVHPGLATLPYNASNNITVDANWKQPEHPLTITDALILNDTDVIINFSEPISLTVNAWSTYGAWIVAYEDANGNRVGRSAIAADYVSSDKRSVKVTVPNAKDWLNATGSYAAYTGMTPIIGVDSVVGQGLPGYVGGIDAVHPISNPAVNMAPTKYFGNSGGGEGLHCAYTSNVKIDEAASGGLSFSSGMPYMTGEEGYEVAPYTYSAWVYLSEAISERGGVIVGNFDSSPCVSVEVHENGVPRFYLGSKDETTSLLFSSADVRTGDWAHLAFTISDNTVSCYLNGELVGEQTLNNYVTEAVKQAVGIGGDVREGNPMYFKGKIKEIALFEAPLTATEIATLYNSGVSAVDKELVAHYDMTNAVAGKDIEDLSDNGYTVFADPRFFKEKDPVGEYEYSFAFVGDTQIVTEKYPDQLSKIYDWLLANKDTKKIKYVFGLGDITNSDTDIEWATATNEIFKLNGNIPYSVVRGNHDTSAQFNKAFNTDAYKNQFEGFYNNELTNSWRTFKAGNVDYLFICFDFGPSDDVLNWAADIIEAHPNHKVIITTHSYLYHDGTTLDVNDDVPPSEFGGVNNGDHMWDKLVSKYENIVLVVSGHDPSDTIVTSQVKGVNGNTVTQMLIDPQVLDWDSGATGMVAMFYFSKDGNVEVEYYSTVREKFFLEENQFKLNIPELDNSAPTLEGIEDGKSYYGDLTVVKPEDQLGDIKSVTLDGAAMSFNESNRGTVPADNEEHIIVVEDHAGNKTTYTVVVYKNYTVTYKIDGEVVDTQTIGYGKDAVAPNIPEKEGYTQTAPVWDKASTNITTDTEIKAVYTINKYTVIYKIDGEVVDTQTVEHGSDAVAPTIPEKEGYTQTAPVWDKASTNITTDTEIKAVYTKNESGKYTDTTPKTNAGGGKLDNTIDELKQSIPFTEEELQDIDYGADVEIWLEVKDISDRVSDEDKLLIEQKLDDDSIVGLYLDIAIFKQIGNNPSEKLTALNDHICVSMTVPDSLISTKDDVVRSYQIIRIHNGVAEIIDPQFYPDTNTLTFETDRFSTYALAYRDTEVPATPDPNEPEKPAEPNEPEKPAEPDEPEKPAEPNKPEKPAEPNEQKAPATGDNINLWILAALMFVSAVCLVGSVLNKRRIKEANKE